MAKIKVYEIAKEVNKRSKEIINFLNSKGIDVTSHMSNIDDKGINLVRNEFASSKKSSASQQNKPQANRDNSAQRNRRPDGQQGDRNNQVRSQDGRPNRRPNNQGQNQDNRGNRPYNAQGQNRDNRSNRPYNSQGQNRDNRSNRPYNSQGQSQDNRSNRPYNAQGQRPNKPYNNKNENNRSNTSQARPGQNKNYNKPMNRTNNSGRGDMYKKDFIANKLDNIENTRGSATKSKKTNNAAIATSRSEATNRRNRDKKKNNKNFDNKNNVDNTKRLNKGQFIKPKPEKKQEEKIKVIEVPETITIKELASKMRVDSSDIIKKLFLSGKIVTINEEITYEEAEEIAIEYDILVEEEVVVDEIEEALKEEEEDPASLKKRPPVVCVMGHVDHGKTSLLDAIRQSKVTTGEAGGITQHIGAYVVESNDEKITFLDTPGHEAFTSMRMRGAQSTDIAILVVAADDGVMPQTIEAINHAKAAEVEIIVAINKIDKPTANPERVKQELTEHGLVAEDWGGDTVFVPVSALTGEGIDTLLEMVILTAEMLELKANPDRNARGLVIEAELDKGRGPVVTVLVQKGTLRVGDPICIGMSCGRVRAMINDKGHRVEEAGPSTPVEILGLGDVPEAGEIFVVSDTEKEARQLAEKYLTQNKERLMANTRTRLSLDGLFSEIQAGNIKDLNLIVKADVQGSVEAVKQSLEKLSNDEVAVRVIHGAVGAINESDVTLASASNAVIIGFNVRPDNNAKDIAAAENVDIRLYRVIYNAIEDVENAMKGMLDPEYEEKVTGHLEIREVYKASGIGSIAGCYVTDGFVTRSSKVRLIRDGIVVYDGVLASLKRFQDDVKEVKTGFECGVVLDKYNDIKVGDILEVYVMEEIPR